MVKTSVSIPDDVYEEARKSSDNFSLMVTEALRAYMRKMHIEKARKSFGRWRDRGKDSVEIVNELRREEARGYARRSR